MTKDEDLKNYYNNPPYSNYSSAYLQYIISVAYFKNLVDLEKKDTQKFQTEMETFHKSIQSALDTAVEEYWKKRHPAQWDLVMRIKRIVDTLDEQKEGD